jgi:hypothetical protein
MGPYAGVDYNSPYLIVNSLVSYSPHYKGKGVDLGRSLLLVEHICIYLLISKTGFFLCETINLPKVYNFVFSVSQLAEAFKRDWGEHRCCSQCTKSLTSKLS